MKIEWEKQFENNLENWIHFMANGTTTSNDEDVIEYFFIPLVDKGLTRVWPGDDRRGWNCDNCDQGKLSQQNNFSATSLSPVEESLHRTIAQCSALAKAGHRERLRARETLMVFTGSAATLCCSADLYCTDLLVEPIGRHIVYRINWWRRKGRCVWPLAGSFQCHNP